MMQHVPTGISHHGPGQELLQKERNRSLCIIYILIIGVEARLGEIHSEVIIWIFLR